MKRTIQNSIRFIFCSIFIFIQFGSFGQNPLYKSFDIRSENTRPKILKLLLDHNGLIWVGTDKGIFTFDGISFIKVFSPDSNQLFVSALFVDKSNCIWAGFENGKIVAIKNQYAKEKITNGEFPKTAISSITEDNEGRIFFSTKGEGVYCIENNQLYNINVDDGLSDSYCYSMIKLPDQRMCVGTDAGLNFVSFRNGNKTITNLGTSEGLPDDIVRTLTLADDNILFIGMQDKGVAKYDCKKNKLLPFNIKQPWNFGQINCILPVDDKLWVTTDEKGIIIIDRDGFIKNFNLNEDGNIKSNDLLLDFENNVWIAESIHLYRTSGNKIEFIQSIGEKSIKFVHCIVCDKNGDVWFSPDQQLGNLFRTKDGLFKYREFKITQGKTDIVTLYFDKYGYLWIGTLGNGVFRFNTATGKFRKITETNDIESSSILSINGDEDIVWVAGFNSVIKFNILSKGNSDDAVIVKEKAFNDNQELNDYVYSVFIDSKKRVWFATDGGGVYSYSENKLTNIPVPDNTVHSFTEDIKGRIWYSTSDAGLQYIETDGTIKYFQTKDGLSDPSPTSLLCTKTGNIVVMNVNGFDLLNPETKSIIYHSSEENLADINCDLNVTAISPDSSIWMGTEKGIIHYIPSSDMKMTRPKVSLESISVFLEAVNFQNKNIFDSDENNFRFDYNGIWYSDPQRINYLFLLEGYSTKWSNTKDHTITFPKLPPGKYVFRIKASLNNSFENAEEASYTFTILPPIWKRLWFRLLSAGVIVMVILMIVRRRENRLRKFDRLQKEKIEFQFETLKSQVNPHFLFNSFNTLISVIEDTPKEAVEYVERLSEFFRNIVTYRDKNLINLNEEFSLLDNYIFIQKKRYGDNLKLEIIVDNTARETMSVAPLTLQLLAENAIKHNSVSKETPLTISIRSDNEKLIITNNINEKIAKEKSTGFGLQNIKNRYELLTNEKVQIIISENNFTVIIPLINSYHEYTDS